MSVDLECLLLLPRPEYAKQTELVVVDLLWNSPGTALGKAAALDKLPQERKDGHANRRIVLEALGAKRGQLTETRAWAASAATIGFASAAEGAVFADAALNSVRAPQSRRDKSVTCVPVHTGIVPLQTLNGAVNKSQPPDLARAVELMSAFGGAPRIGEAAFKLAKALEGGGRVTEVADMFFAQAGEIVWTHLGEGNDRFPDWTPDFTAGVSLDAVADAYRGVCPQGPARWFWEAWTTLMDPRLGWRDALPDRRFSDWATCVLRTGLAMTYLWEGAVFRALRDFLLGPNEVNWRRVHDAFREPRLLTIARPEAPPAERNVTSLLEEGLGDAYHARMIVKGLVSARPGDAVIDLDLAYEAARRSMAGLVADAEAVSEARPDPRNAPKSMKEFVRYLLLERAADDSAADEADLYYLARSKGKRTWIEPGPEWLVVVASLAALEPGHSCTLQTVAEDCRKLGIEVDRSTLVGLLEGAGLTQDSPDADEAIVVNAGF